MDLIITKLKLLMFTKQIKRHYQIGVIFKMRRLITKLLIGSDKLAENNCLSTTRSKSLKKIFQNCGARPSGPIYPHPPLNTNHNPQLPMHCDMIYDDLYVQGYKCNTTCQAVPEQEVQVECDCLRRIMGLTFPQPCKWVYKTMEGEKSDGCPAVPESMPQYDWQCDPRNGTCAEGKCVIVKFTTYHKLLSFWLLHPYKRKE